MRYSVAGIACALSVFVVLAASAEPVDLDRAGRDSTKVFIFEADANVELAKMLVGDGIEGITPVASPETTSGGGVSWERVRESVDDKGHRHVFYRQYYSPKTIQSATNPVVGAGVWLVGAEVGLHYDPKGKLFFVFGTQFEDVLVTSVPFVGDAAEAYSAVQVGVQDWPGFLPGDPAEWSPSVVESDIARTRLLLHSTGDGRSFRYVWESPTRGDSGVVLIATLDAETGKLVSLEDQTAWSECSPNPNTTQDGALGEPQNQSMIIRWVWATEASDRGEDYTHEAHKKSSSNNPDIQVFMGTDDDACDWSGTQLYSLMPIKTIGYWPKYDDYTSPTVPGRSGTDAMFFTYKTMATLKSWGRNSWNGSGGAAKIVVDADCDGVKDNAMFNYGVTRDWVPEPGVAICERNPELQPYTCAAALDIVAHEWGHGVVYTSAGWSYAGEGKTYHEGFADIIGYAVEWANQAAGTGDERAEWQFGEDRGTPWRFVDADDGPVNTSTEEGYYSYHADDPPRSSIHGHYKGHRLGVAYYLMAEGNRNPLCDEIEEGRRPDLEQPLSGCDVYVTDIPTSWAGRILFDVLTYYATSSTVWEDFGDMARIAAYSRFSQCPMYNAETEQQSAIDAFTAIGYPPSVSTPTACKFW